MSEEETIHKRIDDTLNDIITLRRKFSSGKLTREKYYIHLKKSSSKLREMIEIITKDQNDERKVVSSDVPELPNKMTYRPTEINPRQNTSSIPRATETDETNEE